MKKLLKKIDQTVRLLSLLATGRVITNPEMVKSVGADCSEIRMLIQLRSK